LPRMPAAIEPLRWDGRRLSAPVAA